MLLNPHINWGTWPNANHTLNLLTATEIGDEIKFMHGKAGSTFEYKLKIYKNVIAALVKQSDSVAVISEYRYGPSVNGS